MRLHLAVKSIDHLVVEAAQRLIEAKPWTLDEEGKISEGSKFCLVASAAYNLEAPSVQISPRLHFGAYDVQTPINGETVLVLKRWSIIQLFCAFREYVLESDDDALSFDSDPDGWACSLFYSAKPTYFRWLVRRGKIRKVTPRETFTTATWEKLERAGLTRGDKLRIPDVDPRRLEEEGYIETIKEGAGLSPVTSPTSFVDYGGLEEETADYEPTYRDPAEVVERVERASDTAGGTQAAQTASASPLAVPVGSGGLDSLNRDQLRALARGGIVPGANNMRRDELIEALRDAGVQEDGTVGGARVESS